MATRATDAAMPIGCCNGHPSSPLQDPAALIAPASPSINPCKHFYRTCSNGNGTRLSSEFPFNYQPATKEHICDIDRDIELRVGRTSRVRRILPKVVLFTATVVISVTLSCLVMRYLSPQGHGAESGPGGQTPMRMCVPCSPKEVLGREGGQESGQNVFCCASDEAKMQQLIVEGVRLSLQDRLKGEELYTLLNNPLLPPPINKDAAHVFYRPSRRSRTPEVDQSEDDYFELLRDWSSDGSSAFVRSGIEFNSSRGHFRVKNAGVYVVYSRIVYENADVIDVRSGGDVTADKTRFIFGHSVVLYQRNQYKPLLEDEQTMACDVNTVCYNSQIFSTLHLTKDSHIAIRVLQSKFVSLRSHASYFGLYKID